MELLCERCGKPMEIRQHGSTKGAYCNSCGHAVVTTDISDLRRDVRSYEVRVLGGDPADHLHVKAVAGIAQINFLEARRLLSDDAPLVFRGIAVDVVEVRSRLRSVGLKCSIEPDFRW